MVAAGSGAVVVAAVSEVLASGADVGTVIEVAAAVAPLSDSAVKVGISGWDVPVSPGGPTKTVFDTTTVGDGRLATTPDVRPLSRVNPKKAPTASTRRSIATPAKTGSSPLEPGAAAGSIPPGIRMMTVERLSVPLRRLASLTNRGAASSG